MPVPPFQSHSMPTTCPWSASSFLATRYALRPYACTRRSPLRELQRGGRVGPVESLYPYHPSPYRTARSAQRRINRLFPPQFCRRVLTPTHRQPLRLGFGPLRGCTGGCTGACTSACTAASTHAQMPLKTADHMRIDGGHAAELECFKSVAMKCKCNLQTAHSALYVARGQRSHTRSRLRLAWLTV
jgi:hypothetical protein